MLDETPEGESEVVTPAPVEGVEAEKIPAETPVEEAAKVEEPAKAEETKAEPEAPKPRRSAEQRIAQKHAEAQQWKAHATQGQRTVEALTKQLAELQAKEPADYNEQESIRLRTVVKADRLEQAKSEVETASEAATSARREGFFAKVSDAADRLPGIHEAVQAFARVNLAEDTLDLIAESPYTAEIAFVLGKDMERAAYIQNLPPVRQAVEIARMENQLAGYAKPKTVSTAPAPAPIVSGGRASSAFDPESASMDEFSKRYRARQNR